MNLTQNAKFKTQSLRYFLKKVLHIEVCVLTAFEGFAFFFVGCYREKQDLSKIRVKGKSLISHWVSEELFPISSPPLSLSLSPSLLLRGDFLRKKGEEIVFYSPALPNVYILSSSLSLIQKLPFSSLPPKVFSLSDKDILGLSNGKELLFFTKGQRGNLSHPYRLRVADTIWLKDFFITEWDGRLKIWTLEERGKEYFLCSYSLPRIKVISEEKLSSAEFLCGRNGNLFLLTDKGILARGRNNWENEITLDNFMAKSALSSDGKTLFLLLFDSTGKGSRLFAWQTEDGKNLKELALGGDGIFFNDLSLYDFDNDGQEEIILTYSGKEGGIIIRKGGKFISEKKLLPSLFYHRIIVYLLGIFPTDEGDEIMVNIVLEKEKGVSENWLYRLSPKLKVHEVCDLEDMVCAFTPLPNGFLTVGKGLAIYKWE